MTRRSLFHLLVIAPLAAIMGMKTADPLADAPSGFKLALARFRAYRPMSDAEWRAYARLILDELGAP